MSIRVTDGKIPGAVLGGGQAMAVMAEVSMSAPEAATGMPRHVAIIMDANGRWATAHGLPRLEGHRRGMEALRRVVRAALDLGIPILTVYSFSSENWTRPIEEVRGLLNLLRIFVRDDLADLDRRGVRVKVIGDRAGLSADLRGLIEECEQRTAANTRMTFVIAFNYGARDEIARAVRVIARAVAEGRLSPEDVGPDAIAEALDTGGLPDPDLIIRTGGDHRLSNFLLWQAAYAELVFLPITWPEFDGPALRAALAEFGRRERRFGGLGSGAPA